MDGFRKPCYKIVNIIYLMPLIIHVIVAFNMVDPWCFGVMI